MKNFNDLMPFNKKAFDELNDVAISKGYYIAQSVFSGKYFLYKGDYNDRATAYELVFYTTKSFVAMKNYIEKLKGVK